LVKLFTYLGLETGFRKDELKIDPISNAGLEKDIRDENAPYIVKSPWPSYYLEDIIKNYFLEIEHLIIPVRDLKAAAESRKNVEKRVIE